MHLNLYNNNNNIIFNNALRDEYLLMTITAVAFIQVAFGRAAIWQFTEPAAGCNYWAAYFVRPLA